MQAALSSIVQEGALRRKAPQLTYTILLPEHGNSIQGAFRYTKKENHLAKTRRTKPPTAAHNGSVATDEPPELNPQEVQEIESARPEPIRPLKSKQLTFLETVRGIADADWGTRAKLTLYRLEPLIDQLRAGNVKYINVYHEPVDEQRIKLDYGSRRYSALSSTFSKR